MDAGIGDAEDVVRNARISNRKMVGQRLGGAGQRWSRWTDQRLLFAFLFLLMANAATQGRAASAASTANESSKTTIQKPPAAPAATPPATAQRRPLPLCSRPPAAAAGRTSAHSPSNASCPDNTTTATTTTTTTSTTTSTTANTTTSTTASTTTSTTTSTTAADRTDYFYWMVLHVEVIGGDRNESNVTAWLEEALRAHLDTCGTPDGGQVNDSTSAPSPTPYQPTNMTSNPAYQDTSQSNATIMSSFKKAASTEISSLGPEGRTRNTTTPTTTPLTSRTSTWAQTSGPNTTLSGNSTEVKNISVFQHIEVCCNHKERINRTVCSVLVKLSSPRSPCCFRHALWNSSRTSETSNKLIYASILDNRVKLIRNTPSGLMERCKDCSSNSTSGSPPANCTSSGESQPDDSAHNCSSEFDQLPVPCNCSQTCENAYFAMAVEITNSSITAANIRSKVSTLEQFLPHASSGVVCENSTGGPTKCWVMLKLSKEESISKVNTTLTELLSCPGLHTHDAWSVALCGGGSEVNVSEDQWGSLSPPQEVNINSAQFCAAGHAFLSILSCQKGKILIVKLKDSYAGSGSSHRPTATPLNPPSATLSITTATTATAVSSKTSAGEPTPHKTAAPVDTSSTATTLMQSPKAPTNTAKTPRPAANTVANSSPAPPPLTPGSSAEEKANALLALTQDVSLLNSSQVQQLVSQLEALLSGPNVSLALGRTTIHIVSNLLNASADTLASSATRLIRIVDTVGLKLVVVGQNESILFDSLALAVRKVDGTNFRETTFSLTDPSHLQILDPGEAGPVLRVGGRNHTPQGSITLPSTLTETLSPQQQHQASRVQFNFYQRSTLFQDQRLGDKELISGILSTSVANLSISGLQDNVIIKLRNNKDIPENKTVCVFWNFTRNNDSGGWDSNGCSVVSVTHEQTVCSCSHLTSFGILLDPSRGEDLTSRLQATILSYITYIGCGISAIFLSITLLTYLAFGKLRKDVPSKILIQLCLALLLLNLVFLLDAWLALYPEAPGLCVSTAFFLHYFLLAAFTWMGLEAVHMYLALVRVFNSYITRFMLKLSVVGWGVPLLVVIIVIAIDKDNYGLVSYGRFEDGTSDQFCWLRSQVAFYVAVVAFFWVVFLMNVWMFVVVLVQLRRIKRQNPHSVAHRSRAQDLRSVAGLSVLLGLTWGFGLFAWGDLNLPFMYLFAIFNSLQGLFIFVFHCAVKENVRRHWRTYLCCGRLRLPENSDWSRTATQKKSRITSLISSKSSHHSSSSSSYLAPDRSIRTRPTRSPVDDRMTSDTETNSDVVQNEIHSRAQVAWITPSSGSSGSEVMGLPGRQAASNPSS